MKIEGNKKGNSILVDGLKISYSDLLLSEISEFNLNSYYQNTLTFIKEWLSGKNEFQLQTSGSTGIPKIIKVHRNQMVYSAEATARALKLTSDYSALVCLNTKYIAGIMMLVRSLVTGMKMTIIEPSSNPLESFSSDERFDFTAWVPLQLETIMNKLPEKKELLNAFKCIIIGGAPVNEGLLTKIKTLQAPVYSTYGMTETLSHIALQQLNGDKPENYFKALENVELGLDSRGCLMIKSPVTLDKTIVTNDVVELIEKDKFKFLGRFDNVINSGGVKIFPEKVETLTARVFESLNINCRFFLSGTPDERLGQQVTLFIEGEPFLESQKQLVIDLLRKELPLYEVPKKLVFLKTFNETETGKVDRKASILLSNI